VRAYSYPILLGISALSISLSSAYYSVYGLGALFAGAAVQIMVMAGTLEFAKVVLSGFLHRFWTDLPAALRYYLSGAVVILIVISSMGIYGYLASAYQSSSLEFGDVQQKIESIEGRKQRYTQQIASIGQERQGLTSTILTLSQGLSGNTVQYVDPKSGQVLTTQSSAARNILQQQLVSARAREDLLSRQADAFSDSLIVLDDRIFEIKESSNASRNLGPLLFLSEVSGMPMDRVVNILIVVIMLVFDPLAVTMIVATSVSFDTVRARQNPQQPPIANPTDPLEPVLPPDPAQQQSEEQSDPTQERLELPKEFRKVKQIKKIGNYYHVTYEDNSIDRVHEDKYYHFVNTQNLESVDNTFT
jgi:hypothetical protein